MNRFVPCRQVCMVPCLFYSDHRAIYALSSLLSPLVLHSLPQLTIQTFIASSELLNDDVQ